MIPCMGQNFDDLCDPLLMDQLGLKPQLHCHDSSPDPDLRQLVKSGCIGKKRNSSINTMSHDAPTVSARFIYGPTTTHDGSATIHHGGATNAHDASTIRFGASTIRAGSVTVASRPPTNLHHLVVVMRQSQGGGGGGVLIFFLHTQARAQHLPFTPPLFFFIRKLGPSIYRSPPPPQRKTKQNKNEKQEFQEPPKIFEILATPKNTPPHSVP